MTSPDPSSFDPALLQELDVRDLLRRGEQPLALILETADALGAGQVLHLRSPFEPIPLFRVLNARGFEHHSTMFESDDWSTWFWRPESPPAERPETVSGLRTPVASEILDLRALPPPEPMLRILEMIDRTDSALVVALPVIPTPLIAILDGYGWTVTVESELADGSCLVRVAQAGT